MMRAMYHLRSGVRVDVLTVTCVPWLLVPSRTLSTDDVLTLVYILRIYIYKACCTRGIVNSKLRNKPSARSRRRSQHLAAPHLRSQNLRRSLEIIQIDLQAISVGILVGELPSDAPLWN